MIKKDNNGYGGIVSSCDAARGCGWSCTYEESGEGRLNNYDDYNHDYDFNDLLCDLPPVYV